MESKAARRLQRVEVRSYYVDLLRAAPDFHIEVLRRHATDEAVVLEVRLAGTHLGAWRGLPGTGRRFDFARCCSIR